jgi:nucleoid-associated protein YgaU
MVDQMLKRPVRRGRAALVVGGVLLGYLLVAAVLLWGTGGALTAVGAAGPAEPGAVVALVAAAAAWVVLTWLTVVTSAALATAATAGVGSRAHAVALALAPGAARRIVSAALGLALVAAPVAAALPADAGVAGVLTAADRSDHAGTTPHLPATPVPDRPAATVPTGWTPDRPVRTHRRSTRAEAASRLVTGPSRAERRVADEVVVRRGDSLWDIAARHLGPDASAADVAAEWPRWHHANRAVIGADPDLLIPGQRLVPPAGH